jgi:hypothetical protein
MKEKQAVTRETREDYQKTGKKQKGLILNQFTRLTGYNWKYAARLLAKHPIMIQMTAERNTLIFKAEKNSGPKTGRANRSTPRKPPPVLSTSDVSTGISAAFALPHY